MNKLTARKASVLSLLFGGAFVVAFASGCSGSDASAGGEHTATQSAAPTVIESSAESRANGIAYYSIDASGDGRIFGVNGKELATFNSHTTSGKSSFTLTSGSEQLSAEYTAVREGDTYTIAGTTNGKPFHVSATKDGALVAGALQPEISPGLQKLLTPMSKDLASYSSAHERGGCALAGAEVIVSAFLLEPVGIAFGFAGILMEC